MQALPSDAIAKSSITAVGASSKQKLQLVPKKAKKQTGKVDARASEDEASTQVRGVESYPIPGSPIIAGSTKLVVFNVHGTLLDCSLLDERNLNTEMKASAYTVGRRIIFRPWMADFLNHCFLTFKVAFWDSKSARYMQEMVPVMLGRLKGEECVLCFVWSAQECVPIGMGDGTTIEGGKPLESVYRRWPCWNATNTVIVDHNVSRMACNPISNIVAAKAFYVEHLQKLGDDKSYLKRTLWPLLQVLFDTGDVEEFHSRLLHSTIASNSAIQEDCGKLLASEIHGCLQGEGTTGLRFKLEIVPSPCISSRF
jgi:hypothetical protein